MKQLCKAGLRRYLLGLLPVALAVAPSCSNGFGTLAPAERLIVTHTGSEGVGAPGAGLPLSFTTGNTFTMQVQARKPDGTLDTTFNGFVRASVKPGTVASVSGPNSEGRNVQLINGVATDVHVTVVAAFGPARIWFEDIGYTPAEPTRVPPPQCSDGKDNNGNGKIDFPADPGCAFANDDTENSGTFATGTSDTIYFAEPRIADVRGGSTVGGAGNGTVFPSDQVQIDTGFRDGQRYAFTTVVTRIAAAGFYATDLQDDYTNQGQQPPGYSSVYAFTFSTPPLMRVCDIIQSFGGTASDFFGFTEIGFPTWVIQDWDQTQGPCRVPEPHVLTLNEYNTPDTMFQLESSLVRFAAGGTVTIAMPAKLGPAFPKKDPATGAYVTTPDATNCDFNNDGKIEFVAGGEEEACAYVCIGGPGGVPPPDPDCSEFSAYAAQGDFTLKVTDTAVSQTPTKVAANGSADAQFDPTSIKGQQLGAFTGTVAYFSGGSQFTIQARCSDDIISDPNGTPLSSQIACVHARTPAEILNTSH